MTEILWSSWAVVAWLLFCNAFFLLKLARTEKALEGVGKRLYECEDALLKSYGPSQYRPLKVREYFAKHPHRSVGPGEGS